MGDVVLFEKKGAEQPDRSPNPFHEWFVEPCSLKSNEVFKGRFLQQAKVELYDNRGNLRKVWPVTYAFADRMNEIFKNDNSFGFRTFSRPFGSNHSLSQYTFEDKEALMKKKARKAKKKSER